MCKTWKAISNLAVEEWKSERRRGRSAKTGSFMSAALKGGYVTAY